MGLILNLLLSKLVFATPMTALKVDDFSAATNAWTQSRAKEMLALPPFNRDLIAKQFPLEQMHLLDEIAFNEQEAMGIRWRSFMMLVQKSPVAAISAIEKASRSSVWYMRNASLVASSQVSPELALQLGQKLIKDKAMVVRAAAVQALAESRDPEKALPLLFEEMFAKHNFRKGQSLWIRGKIAEAIVSLEDNISRSMLQAWINDKDKAVRKVAIKVLEKRFVGKAPLNEKASFQEKVAYWKSYFN